MLIMVAELNILKPENY